MPKYYSVTELARQWQISPRRISDAFYQRKLNEERCMVVGARRLIPADYVAEVETILRAAGAFREVVTCQ
jgi:hypothetical protein